MKQCNAGMERERSDWTNEEGNAGPGADWTNAERKPEARSRLYAYSDCSVRQHPRGVQCRSHTFAQSPLFTEAVADTRGLRRSPGGCGRTGGAHQRRCAARVRRGSEAGGERNVGARNLDLDRSTLTTARSDGRCVAQLKSGAKINIMASRLALIHHGCGAHVQ